MNSCLCVISTKNPNEILLNTIEMVTIFYPEFDIVVIDSDSTDTEIFEKIPSHVIIEFAKNKNWELGAWTYAFRKYNNYKVYMFIQDTLTPICRIPYFDPQNFVENTLYSFQYDTSLCCGGYFEELVELYKNSGLHFISTLPPDIYIKGTAHNSFITNKENVNSILQLEQIFIDKKIVKTKVHAWITERTGGLMADRCNNIRIDIKDFFIKQSRDRK